jgi:beta-lactamase class A
VVKNPMRFKSVAAVLALVLLFALPVSSQPAPAPKPIDLLKQKLEQISAGVSADWGIYIKSLDSGEEIAINADKVMDTMSAIKIPLLVDVYRQVDAGKNQYRRSFRHEDRGQALWHRRAAHAGCRPEPEFS